MTNHEAHRKLIRAALKKFGGECNLEAACRVWHPLNWINWKDNKRPVTRNEILPYVVRAKLLGIEIKGWDDNET